MVQEFIQWLYSWLRGRLLLLGMLAILLSLAAAGSSLTARAEGTVVSEESYPQGIVCDQTWTTAGSPYHLTSGVLVPDGCYLHIDPSVEVRFDDGLALQVDGEFIAQGTESQPITFTSSTGTSPGSWGFIKFTDTAVDATFDVAGNYTGGSILQYATVQYAGSSGSGALWLDHASPFIDHSTIQHNGQSGIYTYYSTGLRITNNTIENNTTSYGGGINTYYGTVTISGNTIANNTASYGGGIYSQGSTVTISGNTISNNTASTGGGIYANGSTVAISGNTISNNTASTGGGIRTYSGNVTISGNTIANNTANYGGGISTRYDTVTLFGNYIAGNTAVNGGGLHMYHGSATHNSIVRNEATDPNGGGGAYLQNVTSFSENVVVSNTAPSRGGLTANGNPTTFSGNNLVNGGYELYNETPYASGMMSAAGNWWGTADSGAIEAEIFDFFDDATKGIVNYSPQLAAWDTDAPPSPPTGPTATPGACSIALSWNSNPESDIDGYRVYYDTGSGFPYATVITVGNVTNYTVGGLAPGTRYYLAVTAYDATGDVSWYSEEVSEIPDPCGVVPPVADFVASPLTGVVPMTVVFTDTSTNSLTSWSWGFGDGATSTAQNPVHTYTVAAVYTVSLVVTNTAGMDVETKGAYIHTYNPVSADFTAAPRSGLAPLTVAFTDTSAGPGASWLWDFGDGIVSTIQNPGHTYVNAGIYTVSLTATGLGGDISTMTKADYINVGAGLPPVADFVASPLSGTAPLTAYFTDTSTNLPTSWLWNFGDGGTSTAQNPSHSYTAGAYTVSLTVTNTLGSDAETKVGYINVYNPVNADFGAWPLTTTVGSTVVFTDASTGDVASWLWDFGDGNISTAHNPNHSYTSTGTYTVSLMVTGLGGDSDTETKPNYIHVIHGAATVDISIQPPAQTVEVGSSFTTTVQIDCNGQEVSGVDSFIDFDSSYLEVEALTSGTALPIVLASAYDNGMGIITYSATTFSGYPTGTFPLVTIQFRAKALTAGTDLTFSTTPGRVTRADYLGSDVTGSVTGATVAIATPMPIPDAPVHVVPFSQTVAVSQRRW